MDWLTDSVIFYGGLIISSASLLIAIAAIFVLRSRKKKLSAKLDEEYGRRELPTDK